MYTRSAANLVHATAPLLVLALGLVAALPAAAQETAMVPPRKAPPVGFHVLVAHASEKEGVVDAECKIMQKRLPMRFGSIKAVHSRDYWTGFGDLITVDLPGSDESMQLRPVAIHGHQLFMQFQVRGRVDTRLRLNSGKPVILGGVPHPKGGLLIIQVEPDFGRYLADPNNGDLPQPVSVPVGERRLTPAPR